MNFSGCTKIIWPRLTGLPAGRPITGLKQSSKRCSIVAGTAIGRYSALPIRGFAGKSVLKCARAVDNATFC